MKDFISRNIGVVFGFGIAFFIGAVLGKFLLFAAFIAALVVASVLITKYMLKGK